MALWTLRGFECAGDEPALTNVTEVSGQGTRATSGDKKREKRVTVHVLRRRRTI